MPASRNNTRVGGYIANSKANIAGQFPVLSPEGTGEFWGLYVSHPWLDKEFFDDTTTSPLRLEGTVTAGFDSISVRNKIMKRETSHDELRVFKAGVGFEESDNAGRATVTGEVYAGFPHFLGSMGVHEKRASRVDAGGQFRKYVGSVTRVTPLPGSMALITSAKGQATPHNLVNSEQMAFGGADTIRGFPESDFLADYGWMSTAELHLPPFMLPSVLKVPFDKKHTALTDAVQLVLFLDIGEGFLNNPRTGELPHKYLVGSGFGFRSNLYDHLSTRLDIGFPTGGERPSDHSSFTAHFGLEYGW